MLRGRLLYSVYLACSVGCVRIVDFAVFAGFYSSLLRLNFNRTIAEG
jgi:hypothetical protein